MYIYICIYIYVYILFFLNNDHNVAEVFGTEAMIQPVPQLLASAWSRAV